ncbi:MAG: MFS transporter [Candidatus Kapaibacteriales bacterium]
MKLISLNSLSFTKSEIWQRNLFYLSLAQFLAMVGMNSVVPFLPLYIRTLGVIGESSERFWSGIIFAGPYFLSIVFVPLWGNLSDRYGKKLMVIRAILGLTLAMFLMGFARNVWELFLLRVFQGAASGFVAANLGFTVSNTPNEKQGYAIGVLQSSQSAGSIVGPLVGGLVSDFFGFRFVFFIVSALCLVSAILIAFNVVEVNKEKTKSLSSFTSIVKFIVFDKKLSIPMIMIVFAQIGIFLPYPILPYYVEILNAPKSYISTISGLLVGISGILNIIFAPFWGRQSDLHGPSKILRISSFGISLLFFLHSIIPSYIYLFPLRIGIGILIAGIVPVLYTHIGKIAPEDKVGGVMGFASSANLLGLLFAFLGSSLISSNFDLRCLFLISGGILILLLLHRIKQ